jgi:hypothetical protein
VDDTGPCEGELRLERGKFERELAQLNVLTTLSFSGKYADTERSKAGRWRLLYNLRKQQRLMMKSGFHHA